jgi:hypothetical protein
MNEDINLDERDKRAAAAVKARQDKIKEDEKNELVRALTVLQQRTLQENSLYSSVGGTWGTPQTETIRYTYSDKIRFALSNPSDLSVGRIADLHNRSLLKTYIDELKQDGKLNDISEKLIADVLAEANSKSATTTMTTYSTVASQSFYRPLSTPVRDKSNSESALLGVGLGTFAVGGLLGAAALLVFLTKAAAISAGASAPFPPLLTLAGAALLTSVILLAVYSAQNSGKSIFNSATAVTNTLSYGS